MPEPKNNYQLENTAEPRMGAHDIPQADVFVADYSDEEDKGPGRAGIEAQLSDKPASLWTDAWRTLRKNPIFIAAAVMMLFVFFVAAFPGALTSAEPNMNCELGNSNGGPTAGHPLGFTNQGCDILARVAHGTRSSIAVGFGTTIGVLLLGGFLGAMAGYFGGWLDAIISRLMDIWFALPLILGSIVLMQVPIMRENRGIITLVLILTIFGWPGMARMARGAVIEVKNAEFVTAAKSLGMSRMGVLFKHVIPNAAGPMIVMATTTLGIMIVAESSLSYLGIGLPPQLMSWGNDIASAKPQLRTNPEALMWPSLMLSMTVLSFMMMGDSLRDALDPKGRTK